MKSFFNFQARPGRFNFPGRAKKIMHSRRTYGRSILIYHLYPVTKGKAPPGGDVRNHAKGFAVACRGFPSMPR